MTSTLYLELNVYPLPAGATVNLYCDIWLASYFTIAPAGDALPPRGTAAGTATCSPTGDITGLDDTKGYWLRVLNPQGYTHWFNVNWENGGTTSEDPFICTVPLVERGSPPTVNTWTWSGVD